MERIAFEIEKNTRKVFLMVKKITIIGLLLFIPLLVSAHPGGTDSLGGHHCWTNCESWGLTYGEYHFHEDESDFSGIEIYYDTVKFVEKTKSDIKSFSSNWGVEELCDTLPLMITTGYDNVINSADMMVTFAKNPNYYFCEEDFECSTNMKYLQDSNGLQMELVTWLASVSDTYCGTDHLNILLTKLLNHLRSKYGIDTSPLTSKPQKPQKSYSSVASKKSAQKSAVYKPKIKKAASLKSSSASASSTAPRKEIACRQKGRIKTCVCPSGYKANKEGKKCVWGKRN